MFKIRNIKTSKNKKTHCKNEQDDNYATNECVITESEVNQAVSTFTMPLSEILLSQGLLEKTKPGGMVTVADSTVTLTCQDDTGSFRMEILLNNIQLVGKQATYIEGMKRNRKKFVNIWLWLTGTHFKWV